MPESTNCYKNDPATAQEKLDGKSKRDYGLLAGMPEGGKEKTNNQSKLIMETKTNPIFDIEQLEIDLKTAKIRVVKMLWFALGFVTGIVLVIIAIF